MIKYLLVKKTTNKKTGPITILTSSFYTCPDACPLKRNGCYADGGPLRICWDKLTRGECGNTFSETLEKLREWGDGQLIRLFQAGDLPGLNNRIRFKEVRRLVKALKNWRAYGYTHKPLDYHNNSEAIKHCNDNGVCINLSANSLSHADELSNAGVGPVTTIVPKGTKRGCRTPEGRRVVLCPATVKDNVTCSICGGRQGSMCSRINRDFIIAFPAHGSNAKKVSEIVK